MFRKASVYQKLYTLIIMAAFMYYLQYWIRLLTQESIPTFHDRLRLPDQPLEDIKPAAKPKAPPVKEKPATAKATKSPRTSSVEKAAAASDNLKAIEGVGPKTEQTLYAAGIKTYKQLASLEAADVRKVLKAGNINANPETWPDQAKLAAAGEWDALSQLQSQLKGGLKS